MSSDNPDDDALISPPPTLDDIDRIMSFSPRPIDACSVCGEILGRAEWALDDRGLRHKGCSFGLHPEQESILAGLPDDMRRWIVVCGTEDQDLARGAFNLFNAGPYWAELTQTPKWVGLKVWALAERFEGPVMLHPSMVDGGYRHDGPPQYDHRETYEVDRWAGTRLAAHAALWTLAQRQEES